MISNSSISRCLKSDFKAFEKLDENLYIIRWGKKDEVERVYEMDEETGEPKFTGEVKETDWCSYESGQYDGELSVKSLNMYFGKSQRLPKMRELKEFGEVVEMTEETLVTWMREYLLKAIAKHDKSKEVEDFTIGGVHIWLDHNLRGKVRENLESCEKEGLTETVLRIDGMEFPVTIEAGWMMYYAVLKYARETWNTTEIHNGAVMNGINSSQGMIDYEDYYPTAYPPKLAF